MQNLDEISVLILPGLGGSGPDHWQTAWQSAFPSFRRVEQARWEDPRYEDWAARLSEEVERAPRPVVLVAHSMGTSLAMRWSFEEARLSAKVAAALLVAASDRDYFDTLPNPPARGWGPMILRPLPYPSMVVATHNDDRVSFARATQFARAWGSTLVDAGQLGHMGSAAKLGLWPLGLFYFGQLVGALPAAPR